MDPEENTPCVYILTAEHFSGGVIETISDDEVPEGDNKVGEDLAVCALEDVVEKRVMGLSPAEDNVVGEALVECTPEDDVEERPMFLLPEEDNEVGEALAVCAPEDVEERAMSLVPEEDNEVGEASAVCAPEDDVEERAMTLEPEEDNEVREALAAGAEAGEDEEEDDDEEDLTKREDYLKVMSDILKEFHISYENGLEAFMVEFIVDYVYSVIEDASLYSVFAKKEEIDMDDVTLAMSMLQVKNKASAWAPELAQSLLKQRSVIQASNSLSSTLPKPPHESETASTSNTDSDVPLESQEKDNSNIIEHDLFDKDITMQTEESESPFSNQILQENLLSSACPLLSLNTDEVSAMETDDPPTIEKVDSTMSHDRNRSLNLDDIEYPSTSKDPDHTIHKFKDLFSFVSGDPNPFMSTVADPSIQIPQQVSSASTDFLTNRYTDHPSTSTDADSSLQNPQQASSTGSFSGPSTSSFLY